MRSGTELSQFLGGGGVLYTLLYASSKFCLLL